MHGSYYCLQPVVRKFSCVVDCWTIWAIMGAICFAVSLNNLAGSSSGPAALFRFRFSSCFIMQILKREMLGVNRGGYLGNGVVSLGKYRTKLVVKGVCFITIIYYWVYLLLAGRLLEVWECQCFLVYLP